MSAKIKLIACDVDGTLVDSRKRVPAGFPEAVRRLRDRGVAFVIASGRQYYNVLKTFDAVRDDILVLPENGALLIEDGEAVFISRLADADVEAAIRAVRDIPTARPILCGVKAAYSLPCPAFCATEMAKYYERRVIAEDAFERARDDTIFKVAFFDDESTARNVWPAVSHFADRLNPVLSGEHWLDIMNKDINKCAPRNAWPSATTATTSACCASAAKATPWATPPTM